MGYIFSKLAYDVLEYVNKPLSVSKIWEKVHELGLVEKLSSTGKIPIDTLSATLFTIVKHSEHLILKK